MSLVALGFGFWGTVISAIAAGVIGRFDLPQTGEDYVLAVCLAVCTFVAQVMITGSVYKEETVHYFLLWKHIFKIKLYKLLLFFKLLSCDAL